MNYKITVKNNKETKYLFLDIDGVLNSFDDYNMTGEEFEKNIHKLSFVLSPNQINLLNKIVEEFNPKIILSSYWRTRYSTKKINKKFKKNNFVGKILDKTTNHGTEHKDRWSQIKKYIKEHNIKNFIILDDDSLGKEAYNHIKPDPYVGLEEHHIDEIRKIWK